MLLRVAAAKYQILQDRARSFLRAISRAPSIWPTWLFLWLGFLLLNALGMVYRPGALTRYFIDESTIFDIGHYHGIARTGYSELSAAFYPMWPLIIGSLRGLFGTSHEVLIASLSAFAIFSLGLAPLIRALRLAMPATLALGVASLFAFNPNSLFHVLSYPESFAAGTASLFLLSGSRYLLGGQRRYLAIVSGCIFCLSLARPVLLQTAAAATCAALICQLWSKRPCRREWWLVLSSTTGAVLGYGVYGYYCLVHLGSFFAPFAAQSHWGRTFGFYWTLFYAPQAVSSSDVVLLWDLQAFYGPAFVLYLLVRATSAARWQTGNVAEYHNPPTAYPDYPRLPLAFLAWFSALFAAAHGLIAFLSLPTFMSIGRHVFAMPFIFYAFGYALAPRAASRKCQRNLSLYVLFSAIYLVCWWERYSRAGWIG